MQRCVNEKLPAQDFLADGTSKIKQGAGAHGYFETTTDVGKKYSMADVFQRVGEKTPITSA